MASRNRSDSRRRDRHWLDEDGMVACNPRDREAAHRVTMGDITATEDPRAVTCKRCWVVIRKSGVLRQEDERVDADTS